MKIEAHACKLCDKIAIAVDGRRLTDHRHPDAAGCEVWIVRESIHFFSDQGPAATSNANAILAGMLGTFLAEGVLAVGVETRAPKTKIKANHLRVVQNPGAKTESKPTRKR